MKNSIRNSVLLALVTAASVLQAYGAGFAAGDLLVYRVGDGSTISGTTAAAVYLDEYTTSGALVQSISLGSSFSAVYNASTEGILSLSQDRSTVIFTGYNKAPGSTTPAGDTYATTARLIGTLSLSSGAVNTYAISSDGGTTTANTIRSATSADGSSAFWVSTSGRVSYIGSPTATGNATTQIDARNSRQVLLNGNQVLASNGSTGTTNKLQSYGTLPTGATTPTALVSLATGDAVNGFALFDLNSSIAGDDTLYLLSTVEGLLRKYTFDGTQWVASGSISASSAANITGAVGVDGSVSLFLTGTVKIDTTTYSALIGLTDASGYNGTLTGSLTTLATAPSYEAFRGIVVVPEPSSMVLIGLGMLGWALSRRSRR